MLHYDGTWSDITSALPADLQSPPIRLNGVWANSSGAFAVGDNGKIIHSSGGAWTTMQSNTAVVFNGIGGSGSSVFAIGNEGKVFRYRRP